MMPSAPEITGVFRQIRASIGFDLHVSSNSDGTDSQDLVDFHFGLSDLDPDGECPFSSGRPVLFGQPLRRFLGVPSAYHAPELIEDIGVDATEGFRCHHVAVVIGPASKCCIELLDQGRHRRADVFADQCSHLLHEGMNALSGWRDVQDPAMLAEGLPEERESVFDVRDHRLLR